MSNFDPQAVAMLQAANQAYAESAASTGDREWPPQGSHDCILRGVSLKPGDVTVNGAKIPLTLVAFDYEWSPAEGAPGYDPARTEPLQWRGAYMRILPGYEKNPNLKDGQKTGYRIDMERLKGACTRILRKPEAECTNLIADLQAIQAACDATSLTVGVNISHRSYKNAEGKDVTVRTDWIRDRLS